MRNPLGVHALVWVGDWAEPSIRRAVEATAALGYDLLEVPLLDPDGVDAALTRRILEEHGLGVSCSLGLSTDADISSADPEVAQRGEDLLTKALDAAVGMGSRYLCGVIYSAMTKYQAPATPEGRANAVAALGRLARRAAGEGVTLGLEVVNRYESNLVNTAAEALVLLDEVGEDNVKVHLDVYHMNIEEDGYTDAVQRCGDRLGYVHVGESHRGYLGTGTIDFAAFFGALGRIGYAGPITFESFSSAVVSKDLSNTLGVWRNLWSDSEDLARHARDFVRAHVGAWEARSDAGG
jgi:D-psicose/D-tagatose/L-ribulose 3-epimerase